MIGQARLLVVYASAIVHDCTKVCCQTIPSTVEVCMLHMCDIHVSLLGCVYTCYQEDFMTQLHYLFQSKYKILFTFHSLKSQLDINNCNI